MTWNFNDDPQEHLDEHNRYDHDDIAVPVEDKQLGVKATGKLGQIDASLPSSHPGLANISSEDHHVEDHKARHATGLIDTLGGSLDAVARRQISLGGVLKGRRRRTNFIQGANGLISVQDSAPMERIDLTVAAAQLSLNDLDNVEITAPINGQRMRLEGGIWVNFTPVVIPPPGGGDWGDGVLWGNRPVQSSPIGINGQSDVIIDNLFFDGLTYSDFQYSGSNSHVCVNIENSNNITVRNCDFYQVSECVQIYNSSNVTIEWNRTDGITGPAERVGAQTGNFSQTHGGSSFVFVRNNKIKATIPVYDPWGGDHQLGTEDVISLFGCSDSAAEYNQIDATNYVRDYGTGTILGDGFGDRCIIRENTYLNPGQVGIAIAGGFDHQMLGNIVFREFGQHIPEDSGNTGGYYWDYNGNGIGGGLLQDNRILFNEGNQGFWNDGGAEDINNNWEDSSVTREEVEVIL
jgi:hypothetical protein